MTDTAGTARQLPRGRHGLPREQVIASQRDRILDAMAETMAVTGYVGTSVAAVLKVAGVSRETFYEQFRSKEDCFAAAYERAVERLVARIAEASAPGDENVTGGPDLDRMERLLEAYFEGLIEDPAYARLYLVEVYAVGNDALARRAQLQESFVALIAEVLRAHTEQQRFACQTFAAAVSAMVTARIAADDLDGLRGLCAPLLDMVRRSGDLYGSAMVADEIRA
ncbi:transcriptional regulator, TetR family [Nocardia amikacinitolerans]|uniref:Transcriptional regulator, TetR family n=1 Tax=Nocardia amikacinitolerans TaxID=756689 RepID=A0A285LS23_9NOCA|nr:TetR/AcrR family transcriptional regulator [Nocardia amikacinitolerans]MCP2276795.1 transcriptional regulator, TetR family [Nocardia amikacinitolerans]MCP2294825.1 transcriptional regulator, TetR family [Nocardia amikacinitolerans]MCP2318531.1 transcriptional regulator, TetR family [Nocardia amikacinitolerans]SNY87253.1 transcriptional regulator, TetR family [Nocardia amikacinitolerans]